jgi:TonB family protein
MKRTILRLLGALVLSAASAACGEKQQELALLRVVSFEYPWLARMAVLQGSVELVATISPEGQVTKVRTVYGPEPLSQPARAALLEWRFTPQASEREAKFVFTFVLDGSCEASSHCPSSFEVDLPDSVKLTAAAFKAIVN